MRRARGGWSEQGGEGARVGAGSSELGAVEWAACSAVLAGSGAFGGRGQRLGGGLEVAAMACVCGRMRRRVHAAHGVRASRSGPYRGRDSGRQPVDCCRHGPASGDTWRRGYHARQVRARRARGGDILRVLQGLCQSARTRDAVSYSAGASACEKGAQYTHAECRELQRCQECVREGLAAGGAPLTAAGVCRRPRRPGAGKGVADGGRRALPRAVHARIARSGRRPCDCCEAWRRVPLRADGWARTPDAVS